MSKQKMTPLMKYVITSKFKDGESAEQITDFINSNFMTNHSIEAIEKIISPTRKTKKPNHMVNKTASGEKGVSIMTQAQSELADEARANNNQTSNYLKKNIHKINDE